MQAQNKISASFLTIQQYLKHQLKLQLYHAGHYLTHTNDIPWAKDTKRAKPKRIWGQGR